MRNWLNERERSYAFQRAASNSRKGLFHAVLATAFMAASYGMGKYAYDDYHDVRMVWERGTQNCQGVSSMKIARDLGRFEICDDDKLVRSKNFETDLGGIAAAGSGLSGAAGLIFGLLALYRLDRAGRHRRGEFYYPSWITRDF